MTIKRSSLGTAGTPPKRPKIIIHESAESTPTRNTTAEPSDSQLPLTPIINESDRTSNFESQSESQLSQLDPQQTADSQTSSLGPNVEIKKEMASSSSTDLVGLDASLPKITDHDAIKQEEESEQRKSSLYVDAFNLALDTVLEDESYLFSDEENAIFGIYRSLDYEAQYLKTNAWFRVGKLGYYYDIKDMSKACASLQSDEVKFAIDETGITEIDEIAALLNMDELKIVAKEAKSGFGNKSQLVASLKRSNSNQGRLAEEGQLKLRYDDKGNKENRNALYMKKLLDISGPCIKLTENVSKLFARVHLVFYRSTEWTEKSLTTLILARIMRRNFPNYFVCRTANIFPTREALLDFEKAIKLQSEVDDLLGFGVPTKDSLQRVLDVMDLVYDRWKELCIEEAKKTDLEEIYLRRFNAAWVYTRIVHKGVSVIGRQKDYPRERQILQELLAQRMFHPSRRGAWYQRLALIEEHYFHDDKTKRKWLKISLDTAEAGLQDPDTHVIYHYDLQKRISKLERKLIVPKKDQHIWVWTLAKPLSRTIIGDRIREDENVSIVGKKTVWRIEGAEGEDEDVSVEEMCLSVYRKEGWKGFHSEGGIIRTIFSYLFYDIMFLPLPNIFQTPYQTCPLDLHTDSFYAARASEINHRLVAISNGEGPTFVRQVHEAESERKTLIIGLDWNFDVDEICEIVECIGGEALTVICKVLCQEYRERGGGMPDLFLWNAEEKKAKFVEVKSENDRLSDTQRLWIDVLTNAGLEVELCAAVDRKNVKEK